MIEKTIPGFEGVTREIIDKKLSNAIESFLNKLSINNMV